MIFIKEYKIYSVQKPSFDQKINLDLNNHSITELITNTIGAFSLAEIAPNIVRRFPKGSDYIGYELFTHAYYYGTGIGLQSTGGGPVQTCARNIPSTLK